jgi:hypothetical protein
MTEDLIILKLNDLWDCDIPFGWIPITGNRPIPDTEVYQASHFSDNITNPASVIRKVFDVTDLYEIQEGGLVTEKKIGGCGFSYDGLEYLYTDKDFRFVIYFSHENSVTVGGKDLIEEIHSIWPDYEKHIWTTPYHE